MPIMKPKVPKGPGAHTVFQRPKEHNQQIAQSVRPQLPRDGFAGGRPIHASGETPKGGYQSMWVFNFAGDTKCSPTTRPAKKVY